MWDTFSAILNIILGFLTIYFYLENIKLKGFEIDRDTKLKKIEIDELSMWYTKKKEELDNEMAERGLAFSSIRNEAEDDLIREYKNKSNKLQAELSYLESLKKYKWIFSK